MEYISALFCTIAFLGILQLFFGLKPSVIYAATLALAFLYYLGSLGFLPIALWNIVFPVVRKGLASFALFTIVMFTGTLDESSKLRRELQPTRKDLAIAAFLLALLHVFAQVESYLPTLLSRLPESSLYSMQLVTILLLLTLGTLLTATSFNSIRKLVSGKTWKLVQRGAYVFFALIVVHILLLLAPAAFAGACTAQENSAVYLGVIVIYLALRIRKCLHQPHPSNK